MFAYNLNLYIVSFIQNSTFMQNCMKQILKHMNMFTGLDLFQALPDTLLLITVLLLMGHW